MPLMLKVLVLLTAVFAVSVHASADVLSADSLPSDPSSIPVCAQREFLHIAQVLTKSTPKRQCEAVVKVDEMIHSEATSQLCSQQPCVAALRQLYAQLPNCTYSNWAVKYDVAKLLVACKIELASISSHSGSRDFSSKTSSSSGSGTREPTTTPFATRRSGSGSSGKVTFAPIGPPTTAPVATSPVPAKTSAAVLPTFTASTLAVAVTAVVIAFI